MHSASANAIVRALLQQRLIADLLPYTGIRSEVKFGQVSASLYAGLQSYHVEGSGILSLCTAL